MDAERSDGLARARAFARECHEEATLMLRELAAIGAPTRHEQARAAWVRDWVLAQTGGEADVAIDDATNVVWRIPAPTHGLAPSHDPAPTRDSATDGALVISAHTGACTPPAWATTPRTSSSCCSWPATSGSRARTSSAT